MAVNDYFIGANFAFMMYIGLTHGAGRLVQPFGTAKQKKLFLKKMFTGQWTGTMLLTEPEAGSDVGALTTSAVKNDDGSYSITGNKIFISSGDHDMAENIIHPVLARIEGAPQGTKGISLFLVPKVRVNDDGSLGEFNDVVCTGIEEKMGIHGNATCSLSLGSKGNCRGTLLGEENKGMRAMFQMMNEARLLVGLQGLACASAAYVYAVNYARERVQGRHLLKAAEDDAPLVPIIEHPDIRRMLLSMKVYVEGMRSLLYYVGNCEDKLKICDKEEDKAKYQGLIDLLIPIAKGYVTDKAFEVCSLGVQVYGGYGYIKEYPMEQLLRDCRITQIYEGTNGIQAMDLLGRKLGMNKGKPIMDLLGEIQKTIAGARAVSNLADIANKVEAAVNKLGEVALHIGQTGMSPDTRMIAFAHAYSFMEVFGDVVFAWLLLWRSSIAAQNLENGAKKKDVAFFMEEKEAAFVSLLKDKKLNREAKTEIRNFKKYCENYLKLEELTGRRLEIAPLYSSVTPERMALEERQRLGLGDEPIRDIFALLEINGLRFLRQAVADKAKVAGSPRLARESLCLIEAAERSRDEGDEVQI